MNVLDRALLEDAMEHPERYPQLTIRVERVEVLPFHKRAPKYEELGLEFALADTPTPSPELVRATRERFRAHGLAVY